VKLTTRLHLVHKLECVELYIHFPNTSSWRSAEISTVADLTLVQVRRRHVNEWGLKWRQST